MMAIMQPNGTEPHVVEVVPVTTVVINGVVEMTGITDFFDQSFATLFEVLGAQGVTLTGPPFALYHSPPSDVADLEVGVPIAGPFRPDRGVETSGLPGGRVARIVHEGAYEQLGSSWERLGAWIGEHGLTFGEAAWEVYLTEPTPEMDPAELRTELNWSVS